MQNSKPDPILQERPSGRQHYAACFVLALLVLSLYMAAQGMTNGLSQFDSSLPGRKQLIALFTDMRLRLGDRVFLQVLVGNRGWLQYSNDRNLDTFQNSPTLPPGGIERMGTNLVALHQYLRERNITLLVVIPPNKATIYPDTLPPEIPKLAPRSELDELVGYMNTHDPGVLIDLRPALELARQNRDVYYKTDTHWNSYGAFVGYTEIMKALSPAYPELTPRELSRFKLKSIPPQIRDLGVLIGSTSIVEATSELMPKRTVSVQWVTYNDDFLPMQSSYTERNDLPVLLMYRDSFGVWLQSFLAPHFSKATFIATLSNHSNLLTFHEVQVAKPNILIVEFVERDLRYLDQWLQHYMTDGNIEYTP